MRARDVFVVQSTCAPTNENLMELLIMVDALKRASARRITAVIPYFGYARQDRRPRSTRVPISAKVVANLLETVGVERVLTMDLHADQIQGFFDIPVDNIYASPVLLADLKSKNYNDLVVVSPDVGGVVRARALAKQLGCDLAIIDKRRPTANVSEVMHVIGEIEGRNCVIMDDMIDTAGTLVKAAEVLKERGAKSVYAYCTHAVFSGPAIERIAKSQLDEVVITNTIPLNDAAKACKKIRQLIGGVPVCRDDPPHHRRRVGDVAVRRAEQQFLETTRAAVGTLSKLGLCLPFAGPWSRRHSQHWRDETMKFVAYERTLQGTGASRRLRKADKVPGIVYGGGEPKMIELDHNALYFALKKEAFHSSLLEMELGGKVQKVLLRDFQMHPWKQNVLHIDFQRVDETTRMHKKVPLHFAGEENSPAVKTDKCLVSHVTTDLEVECLASQLPEFIADRPVGPGQEPEPEGQRPEAARGHQVGQARQDRSGDRGRDHAEGRGRRSRGRRAGGGRAAAPVKKKKDERQNKK